MIILITTKITESTILGVNIMLQSDLLMKEKVQAERSVNNEMCTIKWIVQK